MDGKTVTTFEKLEGVCLHDLVLEIPRKSLKTDIYVKDELVEDAAESSESQDQSPEKEVRRELISRFKKTRSNIEKGKIIDEIVKETDRPLDLRDALVLLNGINSVIEKNEVLDAFLKSNRTSGKFLTIAQLVEILETYQWDSHRYAVVRKCRTKISDPENAPALKRAFESEKTAEKAVDLF